MPPLELLSICYVLVLKHGKETFVFCTLVYLLEDNLRKIWALLASYAAQSGNCVPTFRDKLSVPSSRVKKSNSSWNYHSRCIIYQKSADLIYTATKA